MGQAELLVIDASVLINILGTGAAREVIQSVPGRLITTPQVTREVRKSPVDGIEAPGLLLPLLEGGYLQEVVLDEAALDTMLRLVSAPPPDDLDDGEASVIACAASLGCGMVIDERKGRRICREQFAHLRSFCTLELFRVCVEEAKVEIQKVRKWIIAARSVARMRIPFEHKGWVNWALSNDGIPKETPEGSRRDSEEGGRKRGVRTSSPQNFGVNRPSNTPQAQGSDRRFKKKPA